MQDVFLHVALSELQCFRRGSLLATVFRWWRWECLTQERDTAVIQWMGHSRRGSWYDCTLQQKAKDVRNLLKVTENQVHGQKSDLRLCWQLSQFCVLCPDIETWASRSYVKGMNIWKNVNKDLVPEKKIQALWLILSSFLQSKNLTSSETWFKAKISPQFQKTLGQCVDWVQIIGSRGFLPLNKKMFTYLGKNA